MRWPRFIAHHSDDHHPPTPPPAVGPRTAEHQVIELDTDQLRALSNVFSAPKWLRDAGLASWLLAGVALLIVGLTWLAATTAAIVDPVIVGLIIATVASPAVGGSRARSSHGRCRCTTPGGRTGQSSIRQRLPW